MKGNSKVACGALAVSLISGILGLGYLIVIGLSDTSVFGTASPQTSAVLSPLLLLAGIMAISTLVMFFALPKKR